MYKIFEDVEYKTLKEGKSFRHTKAALKPNLKNYTVFPLGSRCIPFFNSSILKRLSILKFIYRYILSF